MGSGHHWVEFDAGWRLIAMILGSVRWLLDPRRRAEDHLAGGARPAGRVAEALRAEA
jgi:hypothetical protein